MKTDFVNKFVVSPDTKIKLSKWDPDFTTEIDKDYAESKLKNGLTKQMSDLQYKLFADKSQAMLLVLQGMDASGKDMYH